MEIEWLSVDFKTGEVFGQVQVQSKGKLQKYISTGTDSVISVRCSHDGVELEGWDEATTEGRSLLIAVDKVERHILWGGLVGLRAADLTSAWVPCTLESIEKYFMRRYINTVLSWTNADPAQMAVDALAPIVADLDPLEVDAKMTGTKVSGYYDTNHNLEIGGLLEDLSAHKLAGGIEWTVDLEWVDSEHTQVRYVFRIAPRLGTPGGVAITQWTMSPDGGCVTGGTFIEDFRKETGANDTLALSSGEGDSKPRSTRYEATELLSSYARFERRFTPATSITSTTTLDQYAEADHAATRLGLKQLTITAHLDAAPRVNLDWWMGDDIDVSLTCERFPRKVGSDGFWQAGYEARIRTVGWELDLDARTIAPRAREAG